MSNTKTTILCIDVGIVNLGLVYASCNTDRTDLQIEDFALVDMTEIPRDHPLYKTGSLGDHVCRTIQLYENSKARPEASV